MTVIDVASVSKAFRIPTVRRDTVREHVLGLFEPRKFERLQVLDEINLHVKDGESFGIMGRNGCGKSTLLKIVCGVYAPDAGQRRRERLDYADSRAGRRLESRAGRRGQRLSGRARSWG